MKVLFNTCLGAFFQKGGGEVQLLKSKQALERLGIKVDLYDNWCPQNDFDIFHQFSIEPGVESVIRKYKDLEKKIALSTIMWNLPDKEHSEFSRIRSVLEISDILFTNSDMESDRLASHFQIDRSKFHKTINCISDNYTTIGNPVLFAMKYHIEDEFILTVANVDRRKNIDNLVLACKKVGVRLITIGHIKDQPYFDSFKDTYEGYTHLGPIEDEEMLKSAYMNCSLFALPSYCETPGISALEAASQGARILVTNEGCAKEYFSNMATYVNPNNFESLASKISTALGSPPNSSYVGEYVRKNYRWDRAALEIASGYGRIK